MKLLSLTIDNNLKCDEFLNNTYVKSNRKLTALTKVGKYLDIDKIKLFFKTFFEPQVMYRPLTCMFCSRTYK